MTSSFKLDVAEMLMDTLVSDISVMMIVLRVVQGRVAGMDEGKSFIYLYYSYLAAFFRWRLSRSNVLW